MEMSEHLNSNYMQAFQTCHPHWLKAAAILPKLSNTDSRHQSPRQGSCLVSDINVKNSCYHPTNMNSTRRDETCVFHTVRNEFYIFNAMKNRNYIFNTSRSNCVFNIENRHRFFSTGNKRLHVKKNSTVYNLLLRCFPTAACSTHNGAQSTSYSSSNIEALAGESLPGMRVVQNYSLGQNHHRQISEQELSQWLEKESGLDRIRMMYSLGSDGKFVHEDMRLLSVMWYAITGAGAVVSVAVTYLGQYAEKQKKLSETPLALRGGLKKGVNWNKIMADSVKATAKMAVSTGLLFHLSQAIAAYRNKSSVWEYAIASTLAFGVLGLGHNLKQLARMSLRGAAIGTVGGYFACKALTSGGFNQEQKHLDWIRHSWQQKTQTLK